MSEAGRPVVLIVMGSETDAPKMEPASEALKRLGVPHEVMVASAHRTPARVAELAQGARERGLRVIIAGAGGAAHLAGVIAAHTTLPVIGVPVSSSPLSGLDALLATAQMPSGVPVATVAIDGARNAGLLAAAILAVRDEMLAERLTQLRREMAARVEEASGRVGGTR